MVLLVPKPSSIRPRPKTATVVRCYSLFDRFFPACGLCDYTEGIYHGDSETPYDVAQKNQINYVLNEVGCTAGTRLLEIGCGNGTLLEAARERRAEAIGITISPEQVRHCRSRGLEARLLNYLDLDNSFTHEFDAVVANAAVHLLMKQSPSSIDAVSDAFKLTEPERRELLAARRGDGLLCALGTRVPIRIEASPREHALITTNPAELAAASGAGADLELTR